MPEKIFKIHFIGIGGIGISGLARLFLVGGRDFLSKFVGTRQVHRELFIASCLVPRGRDTINLSRAQSRDRVSTVVVTGSDLQDSEIINDLPKLGAKIFIGKHRKENLFYIPSPRTKSGASSNLLRLKRGRGKKPNLVIYSSAVPETNPELKAARELKIPCLTYAQALGQVTKKMYTIAVSGMHGKSTTVAMIALILEKAGLDPTAIVGTRLEQWQGANARVGKTKYLVIEADEWQASMLNYWPKIIALTNIEEEHLDYYKDLSDILRTFREYIGHLSKDGYLVANGDDKNIVQLLSQQRCHCERSPAQRDLAKQSPFKDNSQKEIASVATLPRNDKRKFFSLRQPEARKLREILKIPGQHNISNALAALTVARVLKIKDSVSFRALANFKGTWRRFEQINLKITNLRLVTRRVKNLKLKIISDYAHHPTEIKATLKAARQKWPKKKIWVVFQPHQYQRTYYLFDKFVTAFELADNLILVKIYDVAGREKSDLRKKVSAKKLAAAIKELDLKEDRQRKILYADSLKKAKQLILANVKSNELLIVMGAGDVYKIIQNLKW